MYFPLLCKNIPLLITFIPLLMVFYHLKNVPHFWCLPATRRVTTEVVPRWRRFVAGHSRSPLCYPHRPGVLWCVNEWPIQQFPLIKALWTSENRPVPMPAEGMGFLAISQILRSLLHRVWISDCIFTITNNHWIVKNISKMSLQFV